MYSLTHRPAELLARIIIHDLYNNQWRIKWLDKFAYNFRICGKTDQKHFIVHIIGWRRVSQEIWMIVKQISCIIYMIVADFRRPKNHNYAK